MRSIALAWAGLAATTAPLLAEGGEGGGGPFAGDIGNALWTVVIFLLVVTVLGKFAWGPLLKGMQAREEFIRASLEQAKHDREAAAAQLKAYEGRILVAQGEATALLEEARRDADAVRRRLQEEAQGEARQIVERARREVALATETAKKDLHDYAAELSIQVARRVLGREITPADHERLIATAIDEIERSSN